MHDPMSMALMGTHYGQQGGCCALPQGNGIIAGSRGGGLVRVLPRTAFTFPLAGDTNQTIVLAKYIDSMMWVSGALLVRIHAVTAGSTTMYVRVQSVSYDEEDPSIVFAGTSGAGAYVASAQIDGGAAGTLVPEPFVAPIAAQVRVILYVGMEAGAVAGSCTIGVDLVARTA